MNSSENPDTLSQVKEFILSIKPEVYYVIGLVLLVFGCIFSSIFQGTHSNGFLSVLSCLSFLAAVIFVGIGFVLRGRNIKASDMAQTNTPQPENRWLPGTNIPITQPVQNTSLQSTEQRRETLQQRINQYIRQGYRVVSQTDTTAQLIKQKQFSCLWATLWFLLFGIGILIYLFYYASKRDEQIYLEVDIYGRVIART